MEGLTAEQLTAVDAVVDATMHPGAPQHFVVNAVAGSGKSRVLEAIARGVVARRPTARVLVLQFNHELCQQMRRRLGKDPAVAVFTMHAFAMSLLGSGVIVDPNKVFRCWRRLSPALGAADRQAWNAVRSFVDRRRNAAWIPTPQHRQQRPYELSMAVFMELIDDRRTIDLEDAIYHCIYYGRHVHTPYDVVLVDEIQSRAAAQRPLYAPDLNTSNHAFLRRCVAPPDTHTVVCGVGDAAQAIYQFRGAHPDGMTCFRNIFKAQAMPLTCCFRCPRRVTHAIA